MDYKGELPLLDTQNSLYVTAMKHQTTTAQAARAAVVWIAVVTHAAVRLRRRATYVRQADVGAASTAVVLFAGSVEAVPPLVQKPKPARPEAEKNTCVKTETLNSPQSFNTLPTNISINTGASSSEELVTRRGDDASGRRLQAAGHAGKFAMSLSYS